MRARPLTAVLPAAILGAAILAASGPWASSERTGAVTQPWFSWFGLSPAASAVAHYVVRKVGHAMAYALFGVLALRATRDPSGPVSWRAAGLAWGLSILLSVADEALQSLSSARGGSASDVLLDSLGAALGLLVAVRLSTRKSAAAEPARGTETEAA